MSATCTSAKLDDTVNYPRFMRAVPTDDATAFAVCSYLDSLNYRFVGMLFSNDDYGEAYKESIVKHCLAAGLKVDAFPVNMAGPEVESSVVAQLANLKKLSLNVVFTVAWSQGLKIIMDTATANGMNGPGKLWVFSDASYGSDFATFGAQTIAQTDGAIRVAGSGGTKYNPAWMEFASDYKTFTSSDFKKLFPSWWQLPTGHFTSVKAETNPDLSGLGAYAYDAIAAYG